MNLTLLDFTILLAIVIFVKYSYFENKVKRAYIRFMLDRKIVKESNQLIDQLNRFIASNISNVDYVGDISDFAPEFVILQNKNITETKDIINYLYYFYLLKSIDKCGYYLIVNPDQTIGLYKNMNVYRSKITASVEGLMEALSIIDTLNFSKS